MGVDFEILAKAGAARRGRLVLNRGAVDTPAFMPVGTYGTVKAVTPEELRETGAQISDWVACISSCTGMAPS